MIIKNWMQKNPIIIQSDKTAKEAMEVFNEHKLSFLPVVDDGILRGILARRELTQAASSVTAAQSIHEVNFFNTRLKVKDLMIRKPVTLAVDDTVETALSKGRKFRRSYFPIMDGDKLVGTISDIDISNSLYQILGIDENMCGITLENGELEGSVIKDIAVDIDSSGGSLYSVFTLKEPGSGKKRLLIRFRSDNPDKTFKLFKEKGYKIVELVTNR